MNLKYTNDPSLAFITMCSDLFMSSFFFFKIYIIKILFTYKNTTLQKQLKKQVLNWLCFDGVDHELNFMDKLDDSTMQVS